MERTTDYLAILSVLAIAAMLIAGCATTQPKRTGPSPMTPPANPAISSPVPGSAQPGQNESASAAPSPATASTDAVKNGSFSITTHPQTTVLSIDGVVKGTAPLVVNGIAHGTHTITVSKDGYLNESRTVTLDADSMRVEVNLTSLEDWQKFQAMKDLPGTISFEGLPLNVDIYFEGKLIGQSPLLKSNVSVGNHTFTYVKATYANYTGIIEVKGGQKTIVKPVMASPSPALSPAGQNASASVSRSAAS